jgi:hypothetical protein
MEEGQSETPPVQCTAGGAGGSVTGYNQGCRCPDCTGAHAVTTRGRRGRYRDAREWAPTIGRWVYKATMIKHGSASAYRTYGCQCPACHEWERANRKPRRKKG